MTVKELKAELDKHPEDMDVAIDDEDIYMVIDYVEPNYDDSLLLIGNTDGFMYQQ